MDEEDFTLKRKARSQAGRVKDVEDVEKKESKISINFDNALAAKRHVAVKGPSSAPTEIVFKSNQGGSVVISAVSEFVGSITETLGGETNEMDISAGVMTEDGVEIESPEPSTTVPAALQARNASLADILKEARGKKSESSADREIVLKYTDEFGNELTPKEAYKELSRKFHGTKPGKKRIEKMLKARKPESSVRVVKNVTECKDPQPAEAKKRIFGMK